MLYVETWYLPGDVNMALDVLLGELAFEIGEPILRLYNWERPTLSIGKFQRFDKVLPEDVGCVRRPSGGRAVLHWKEITYSVAFPRGSTEFGLSILELYRGVSSVLARAFRKLGLDVELSKGWGSLKNESCFSSSARYELVLNGGKFVGSAQFRTSRFALQHGSIVLEYPERLVMEIFGRRDEKALGLYDVRRVSERKLIEALKGAFDEEYGLMSMDFGRLIGLMEEAEKRRSNFSCRSSTWSPRR